MQAIILAAGMGKRLKKLTQDNTKCMVKVDGKTLIERMLSQIEKHNVNRIIIVVGYKREKLKSYISSLSVQTPIVYIDNNIYERTNNIYSLSLARKWLCLDDTLLFESDIIFEDSVLDALVNDSRDTLALVDKYEPWMDGTCVKLSEDDEIVEFIPKKRFKYCETNDYYKTVNIYKFSKSFSETHYVPFLEAYQKALGENEYYEQVLRVIAMLDSPVIKAKRLNGQKWYEIDDEQDLDIAESLFVQDEKKHVALLQKRYGGYWRYPQMLDYCYLVNPFFPPQRMKDELRASFDSLLASYPSGMEVNCMLAAKIFGIHKENIVVGNGAAELIRSLMNMLSGKTGFIRPTFDEYPNRYKNEIEEFFPQKDDLSYSVDDITEFYNTKAINNLVIINPDNPSGNYISKSEIRKLIDWSRKRNINLIIDESFIDFSEETNSSIIQQSLISEFTNLYVVKSISKSYGVPGLRLGVLVSGDRDTISYIKKDVSIWNINSFGEYYLQIYEKYEKNYQMALNRFRQERERFIRELSSIPGIKVFPSQANYVMIEIMNGTTSFDLTKELLIHHNVLIKDLSKKTNGRNLIRLAIRDSNDNDYLLSILNELFSSFDEEKE